MTFIRHDPGACPRCEMRYLWYRPSPLDGATQGLAAVVGPVMRGDQRRAGDSQQRRGEREEAFLKGTIWILPQPHS
jgi:hypothetical protein